MSDASQTSPTSHEGFTVGLALVDAIPVLLFCASMILIATSYTNIIFIIGAVAMAIGGISKVAWKFIIGAAGKDIALLAKLFRPCMFGGFAVLIIAIIAGSIAGSINWGTLGASIVAFPAVVFFALAVCGMVTMGVLGAKLDKNSAKANWIEQCTNCFAQLMLFLGILVTIIA